MQLAVTVVVLGSLCASVAGAQAPVHLSPAGLKAIKAYRQSMPKPTIRPADLQAMHQRIVAMVNSPNPDLSALQRMRAEQNRARLTMEKAQFDRSNEMLTKLSPQDQLVALRRLYRGGSAVSPLPAGKQIGM